MYQKSEIQCNTLHEHEIYDFVVSVHFRPRGTKMKLEFEAMQTSKNDREIYIGVFRKGLNVGYLVLREPYNEMSKKPKRITVE